MKTINRNIELLCSEFIFVKNDNNLKRYLNFVGYNSTVAALTTFPAIPAHINIINEQA